MATRVVHCQRSAYDVYIGRPNRINGWKPNKWGNPFEIGKDGTRSEVVGKYAVWVRMQPELMASLGELKGKTLGCWCAPLTCHGHVLAVLAEQHTTGEGDGLDQGKRGEVGENEEGQQEGGEAGREGAP
jgi:hypothetical protein